MLDKKLEDVFNVSDSDLVPGIRNYGQRAPGLSFFSPYPTTVKTPRTTP
jgi:hypothetical protein